MQFKAYLTLELKINPLLNFFTFPNPAYDRIYLAGSLTGDESYLLTSSDGRLILQENSKAMLM
jgi:hypothetical protein